MQGVLVSPLEVLVAQATLQLFLARRGSRDGLLLLHNLLLLFQFHVLQEFLSEDRILVKPLLLYLVFSTAQMAGECQQVGQVFVTPFDEFADGFVSQMPVASAAASVVASCFGGPQEPASTDLLQTQVLRHLHLSSSSHQPAI